MKRWVYKNEQQGMDMMEILKSRKKYKGKLLFLTNNDNALRLSDYLEKSHDVHIYRERVTLCLVQLMKPDFIISYNYNYIIREDVITYMKGKIINIHISYLPWNRGFSPNIWSFIDHTPKGVTIHEISNGLDQGKILFQKECFFKPEEQSFTSTYQILNDVAVQLFIEHWEDIWNQNYILKEQADGGSFHTKKDLEKLMEKCPFSWNDNIADFLKRYEKLNMSEDGKTGN